MGKLRADDGPAGIHPRAVQHGGILQIVHRLQAAGGADNPRFSAAVRRMERALYYDYELGDDFYPQFCQNIEILMPLLDRML